MSQGERSQIFTAALLLLTVAVAHHQGHRGPV